MRGKQPLRMKGRLSSRFARRRAKIRKKKLLRVKVRKHSHRRYAGVRGGTKKLRRTRLKPHKTTAKRKTYKVKPQTAGQGMPPISMSTYLSMY